MEKKTEKVGEPTSRLTTFNYFLNHTKGQSGLSLIEILVALSLVALIFFIIPTGSSTGDRTKLTETIDALDRASKFSSGEAVLRNTIVRMRILLDKNPIEYFVEYGPRTVLTLPKFKDVSKLSILEQEVYAKEIEKVDKEFNKVPEFEDVTSEISEEVKILGGATNLYPGMVASDELHIYFYPSGERDNALFILANSREIATLEVRPFTEKTIDNYYTLEANEDDEVDEDKFEEKAKEIYEKWLN